MDVSLCSRFLSNWSKKDHQDAEDAILMMSITNFEKLNAGNSVFLEQVSGGIWVGRAKRANNFFFSGEFISKEV